MGNRSLDEFLTSGSTVAETNHDDTDTDGAPSSETTPVIPTMVWTPDGAACESCGETAHRRWREHAENERDGADDRLVCESCKPWK